MKKLKCIALIPARSGSKGYKNKNIEHLNGTPLLTHSIRFAKKCDFIEEIYLLTDDQNYANIGIKHGAKVPYLRDKISSNDSSMEEDILKEFIHHMPEEIGSIILWLRPTHPIRDLDIFKNAFFEFIKEKNYTSMCIVTKAESRIYYNKEGLLKPFNNILKNKSMWRRQEVKEAYKLYHGEFFKLKSKISNKFLGDKIGFKVMNSLCNFDIDDKNDLEYLNFKIKKMNELRKYLH